MRAEGRWHGTIWNFRRLRSCARSAGGCRRKVGDLVYRSQLPTLVQLDPSYALFNPVETDLVVLAAEGCVTAASSQARITATAKAGISMTPYRVMPPVNNSNWPPAVACRRSSLAIARSTRSRCFRLHSYRYAHMVHRRANRTAAFAPDQLESCSSNDPLNEGRAARQRERWRNGGQRGERPCSNPRIREFRWCLCIGRYVRPSRAQSEPHHALGRGYPSVHRRQPIHRSW